MSLILNIDTALETASLCLAEDGQALQLSTSENQKDHASWLHPEISVLLQQSGYGMKDLQAIAVTIGPGSYTGLRVGLAAAKGFCFALQIPLITVNSLKMIAFAVKDDAPDIICPVIDARRMEVFSAIYDKELREIVPPHALELDEKSFASFLIKDRVLFCGNGVKKLQSVIADSHALFNNTMADASHLARLSIHSYHHKEFADLAYTEPLYVKEFFSPGQGV